MQLKVVEFLSKHKEISKVIFSTKHERKISDRAKTILARWKWRYGWY